MIRHLPRMPATAREIMAWGVLARLAARITSPKPGMTRSTTVMVASGVTSRGETPVPPVVRIRSNSPQSAHSVSFSAISRSSSGMIPLRPVSTPCAANHVERAGPLASALSPLEPLSLNVKIAAFI
jgi:hypothetical protein